jgi:hypothetical protein
MRAQWGRRVPVAADIAADPGGRWVVLGPGADARAAPNALQLYRVHMGAGAQQPRLAFVRHLHGLTGPVARLAVGAGRCVCVGADGSVRVWALETGAGAEIAGADAAAGAGAEDGLGAQAVAVAFDDRKLVSVGRDGVVVRRFDI